MPGHQTASHVAYRLSGLPEPRNGPGVLGPEPRIIRAELLPHRIQREGAAGAGPVSAGRRSGVCTIGSEGVPRLFGGGAGRSR